MLEILYQDNNYVAIHKPSGLLVHRSPIDKNETRFALQEVRNQIGQYVYPIHRLDKPTSGVLIFALSSEAADKIQSQFNDGGVQKTYQALVRGFTPQVLDIDYPVKARIDKKHGTAAEAEPKDAQTELNTLEQYELPIQVERYPSTRYSLVELKPKTGRRHQLRYHMKHISQPIIGDAKYGKGIHNRFFAQHFNCPRLMLCATQLSFLHPYMEAKVTIETSLDETFQNALDQLFSECSVTR